MLIEELSDDAGFVFVGLMTHVLVGDPPVYGDFEAQRHWLEITSNLPLEDWYHNTTENDLNYWGLDYPPLTAYVSMVFGKVAKVFVPEAVDLFQSRGSETKTTRAYMRATVLLCDVLVFYPAVWLLLKRIRKLKEEAANHSQAEQPKVTQKPQAKNSRCEKLVPIAVLYMLCLLQPSFILVDHGHFQYNCVSLGFTVWAVYFLYRRMHVPASVCFCLALNFKQIALYFSMPFFLYLLNDALHDTQRGQKVISLRACWKVIQLGATVLLVFGLLWAPFCIANYDAATKTGCKAGLVQVVTRIFPFQRGLFEDKVANLWCSLNIVIKLKQFLTIDQLSVMSLLTTLVAIVPSSLDLFLRKPQLSRFIWALFNSSLSFFLCSFQVHEKGILLPLLPLCFLAEEVPGLYYVFSLVSVFSMFPLLLRDKLLAPYLVAGGMFVVNFHQIFKQRALFKVSIPFASGSQQIDYSLLIYVLFAVCGILHLLSLNVAPPPRYPDLWPVLISLLSFGVFASCWLFGNVYQIFILKTDVEHGVGTKKEHVE